MQIETEVYEGMMRDAKGIQEHDGTNAYFILVTGPTYEMKMLGCLGLSTAIRTWICEQDRFRIRL